MMVHSTPYWSSINQPRSGNQTVHRLLLSKHGRGARWDRLRQSYYAPLGNLLIDLWEDVGSSPVPFIRRRDHLNGSCIEWATGTPAEAAVSHTKHGDTPAQNNNSADLLPQCRRTWHGKTACPARSFPPQSLKWAVPPVRRSIPSPSAPSSSAETSSRVYAYICIHVQGRA